MIETIAQIAAVTVMAFLAIGSFVVTSASDWSVVTINERTGERKTRVVRAVTELGAIYYVRRKWGVGVIEAHRL